VRDTDDQGLRLPRSMDLEAALDRPPTAGQQLGQLNVRRHMVNTPTPRRPYFCDCRAGGDSRSLVI
jgi:hypothetical protein